MNGRGVRLLKDRCREATAGFACTEQNALFDSGAVVASITSYVAGLPTAGAAGMREGIVAGGVRWHRGSVESDSFDQVLRTAIARSGLGLERIRCHLARRGHRVSIATLSQWQSGKRRPERRESLRALAVLEGVLSVPAGTLTGVVGPPRARGPQRQRRVSPEAVWPGEPQVPPLLGEVDDEDEFLMRLSHHDVLRLDADGVEVSMAVRLVLRAARSGVSRLPVVSVLDAPHPTGQWVRPVRHCAVGDVSYLPEFGSMVASLVLEVFTLLWTPAKEASVPNLVPSDHLTTANSLSLVAAYGTMPLAAGLFSLLSKVAEWLGEIDAIGGLKTDQETIALDRKSVV